MKKSFKGISTKQIEENLQMIIRQNKNLCESVAILLLLGILMMNAEELQAKQPIMVIKSIDLPKVPDNVLKEVKTIQKPKVASVNLTRKGNITPVIKGFPQYASQVGVLAIMIECEAGETAEDKISDRIYVGSVIINRAETNHPDFCNVHSIYEVLYQKYQYHSNTKRAVESGKEASPESWYVAQGLIDGTIPCLEECVLYQMDENPGAGTWGEDLIYAKLPGARQYFAIPRDYYGDDRFADQYIWTSHAYPIS